jgi:hypothetical protein
VRRTAGKIKAEADRIVDNKPFFIIKQVALQKFWESQVHPKLMVSPKAFCILLQSFLTSIGISYILAIDLANLFRDSVKKHVDDTGLIDAFAVARLSRRLNVNSEPNIEAVIRAMSGLKGYTILPEYDVASKVSCTLSSSVVTGILLNLPFTR